jgi:X-linked retinitis pigmentosa GTPase regulator
MGSNSQGRLGIGNKSIRQSSSPCLVEDLVDYNCRQVACGWGHSIAIMDRGEIFTWGVGEHGALGYGSNDSAWSPVSITLDPHNSVGAKKAAAGSRHSAFVSEIGTLYTCGSGDAGQLGTGKRDSKFVPEQVTLISERVTDVACGIFHTLILTENGRVYATGGNSFGQLGIGTKKNTNIPTRIKDFERVRVQKIACGHHSAALTEKGDVYVWGTGIFGEYLLPTKYSPSDYYYQDISIGGFFGSAIDEYGVPWTWGSNTSGELGQGDFDPRSQPTKIEFLHGKRVQKISCGGSFVIALGETRRERGTGSIGSPKRESGANTTLDISRSSNFRDSVKGLDTSTQQSKRRGEELSDRVETIPDLGRGPRSRTPGPVKAYANTGKYRSPFRNDNQRMRNSMDEIALDERSRLE